MPISETIQLAPLIVKLRIAAISEGLSTAARRGGVVGRFKQVRGTPETATS